MENLFEMIYIDLFTDIKLIPSEIGSLTILKSISERLCNEELDTFVDDLSEFSEKFKMQKCIEIIEIICELENPIEFQELVKLVIYQILARSDEDDFFYGSYISFKHISKFI
jgi:hypothetical protein